VSDAAHPPHPLWPRVSARQAFVGLVLACSVIGAFCANFVYLVFYVDLASWVGASAPDTGGAVDAGTADSSWTIALVLVQIWLSVGLFIIAHDCMHGSLLPAHRKAGHWLGRLCLFLYAGFNYDRLRDAHYEHHRVPGTSRDPDFDELHPRNPLAWFACFVREYFGWREFGILTVFLITQIGFGASIYNVLAFWALPAMFSAFQLFFFGTFLPHRHRDEPFVDEHRSRTLGFPQWLSVLTCYHFGYHHEHHLFPYLPWWRLPQAHRYYAKGVVFRHQHTPDPAGSRSP
jgi:beta-carotene ketolase (CrtW type)